MESASVSAKHYGSLDGLRGIAILLVIFYHNYSFLHSAAFGWLGVDLFFVLSGFLITNILLSSVERPDFFRNFYMRRMLRIFPLYYGYLALILLLFPLFGWFDEATQYPSQHQAWIWTYLQNILFVVHPAPAQHFASHLWSLSVEEQFYLVWPLLVFIIRRSKPLLLVMFLILALIIAVRIVFFVTHAADFNYSILYTYTRFDGLCIGSIIALTHRINFKFMSNYTAVIVTVLAGFNFLFYFLTIRNRGAYPYYFFVGYTTFTAMFGMLVHELVAHQKSILSRLLSFAPLRYLGKVSYGLYIFHWPIFMVLSPVIYQFLAAHFQLSDVMLRFISASGCALGALIVSTISYYKFESVFLRLKDRFRSSSKIIDFHKKETLRSDQ